MLLGTWGCVIDAIGVILKDFTRNSDPLWPLYTLFVLGGWTIYAPAQLLVLYSRLHIVNQDHKLQRWVLIMIIAVASLMIIPTWALVWQAYDPYDPRLSALYSAREAIVDRCTQLGYTITESTISGIYIWSLAKLLTFKSSDRQRRVMTDLICVNVLTVCLDILTVALVFLNQTGISHPIQDLSYILKFKLEFMVLNQLVALATQGHQTWESGAGRHHHLSTSGGLGSSGTSSQTPRCRLEYLQEPPRADLAQQLEVPSPAFSRLHRMPNGSGSQNSYDDGNWLLNANSKKHKYHGSN